MAAPVIGLFVLVLRHPDIDSCHIARAGASNDWRAVHFRDRKICSWNLSQSGREHDESRLANWNVYQHLCGMRGIPHKAAWNLRKLNLVWTCGSQYLSLFWQNSFKATLPYYTFTSLSSNLAFAFQALTKVDVDVIIIFPLANVIHHGHHLVHPITFDTRAFVGESISSHHRIFHQRMRDGTTQLWWICHQNVSPGNDQDLTVGTRWKGAKNNSTGWKF